MVEFWTLIRRINPRHLSLICVATATVLATGLSHLFWYLLTGSVPDGLTVVAGSAALLVSAPMVEVFVIAVYGLFHANESLVATQTTLKHRNDELAVARDALSTLNAELEMRVSKRTVALKGALEAAEQANATKSIFLANMSHELRTPLNGIIGYAEMIVKRETLFGDIPAEKIDEYAAAILISGQHLNAMVNDLLDLSRIEFGQYDVTLAQVQPQDLIKRIMDELSPMARSRKQEIEARIPPDMPQFETDARAIQQILTNLLTNALKYSGEGDTVLLEVDYTSAELLFTITDHGIGMSNEAVTKATEPFSKFSDAHVAAGQSIGLGLSIVNRLCGLMRGTFDLSSVEGSGTTAHVRLPARFIQAAGTDSAPPLAMAG